MSTVSVTETEPAQEPHVRFAMFRTKVPYPWKTVVALAVVLAAADGFIVTSLQGAVGAIQRAQGPFSSWLRDTAIVLPVFVLAVMWAFYRAHRKHGLASPAMRSWKRTVATALLVVGAATAVGVVETAVSAALDYRLQSQQLAASAAVHGHAADGVSGAVTNNQAYSDGLWSPLQRQTMALDVKAVGFGAGIILATNIVIVGWIVALRGGRLDVVAARRRKSSTGNGATVPTTATSNPATA
jgi:hypothetical protein